MKTRTKTQELITPSIKITPPPPPPRTHLSKHPRPKHLFKASVSRLVLLRHCRNPGNRFLRGNPKHAVDIPNVFRFHH